MVKITLKKYDDCQIETKDNLATISFNDDQKAIKTIKNIIFMEFTVTQGHNIKEGDILLSIESMKGTFQLKSRICGVIKEINSKVAEKPELLATNPTTWLLKVEIK